MAKETGLGANLYIGGYDVSGDSREVGGVRKSIDTIDMTDITESAYERKAGMLQASMDWTSFFNPTNAHVKLSALSTADTLVTYYHRAALATPAANMVAKQLDYAGKRDNKGAFMLDVKTISNAWWLDWGL